MQHERVHKEAHEHERMRREREEAHVHESMRYELVTEGVLEHDSLRVTERADRSAQNDDHESNRACQHIGASRMRLKEHRHTCLRANDHVQTWV